MNGIRERHPPHWEQAGRRGDGAGFVTRRFWPLLGLIPFLALTGAQGGNGSLRPYLPRVGPVPLRFEEPFPLMATKFELPLLDLGRTNDAVAVDALESPASPPQTPPAPVIMEAGPDLDLGQDAFARLPAASAGLPDSRPPSPPPRVRTLPPTPETPPEPQLVQPMTTEVDAISPRVIIKYFNNRSGPANATTGVFSGTNGFVAPIGFQPPAPGQSSSGTYNENVAPPSGK